MGGKLKVDILTLFPQFFDSIFNYSILKRACDADILDVNIFDLREYTTDRHHQADDYRFGGGAGMLLKPEPIFRAFKNIIPDVKPKPLIIYPTPQGIPFNQDVADELSKETHLVFLCGHYKGVDQRVIERWVDREYSLGDYVLTGGEIAAAVMVDSAVRMIPGVLGDIDSALDDSFRHNLLDCPHYTRPENLNGLSVPGVLLSGHHRNIALWRKITAQFLTKKRRPELNKK
ncbi:MAG: tRNA (guanosine(37)-N1)-methyltransferase TrmD [Candidatus Hatepunaea meridiana]|nr:tRNA (guanosine(37)-N1)-methyltransferase TrmD [Candidatus Hatepunaea meridiana]